MKRNKNVFIALKLSFFSVFSYLYAVTLNSTDYMKRIASLILTALFAVLVAASCGDSFNPDEFHAFVDDIESRCATFTEDDWDQANNEYQAYVHYYRLSKPSKEVTRKVEADINRYMTLFHKTIQPVGVNPDEVLTNSQDVEKFLKGEDN